MRQSTWRLLVVVLAALAHLAAASPVSKRQVLVESEAIDPVVQEIPEETEDRDKRKVEGAIELKYGAKNAILGFIFNKINSFIDSKTNWVDQLDKSNIEKNKAYGIDAPKDPVSSFGDVFSSVITNKLQAAGPFISMITSKIGGLSGGASSGGGGGGLGGGLAAIGSLFGGSSGGTGATAPDTGYGVPTDSPY